MTMRSRRRPIKLANTHSCFGIKRSRHFSARHCEVDLPGFACYACTDRHHARSEGEIRPLKIDDKELFAIDSHTHMGRRSTPLGHGIASFLGEDLVRDMDELGLDKAVAFPLGAPYTDYSESNATIAAEVAKFPQRIIGFCRINPNVGPQATAKALDHCLGTLKLSGIKLHPEIEFFDPNEEELMEPVYEAARRYHVPILFHTGMSSKAAPAVIAEVASKYRGSRHPGTHGCLRIRQASSCGCAAKR